MKTTVEIDDELLKAAKKLAIDEHTTLRALIEDGLRTLVDVTCDPRRTPGEAILEIYARQQARTAPEAPRLSGIRLPITRDEFYEGQVEEITQAISHAGLHPRGSRP